MGGPPVVVHLVYVAVADAAVQNLHLDVVRFRVAPLDCHGRKRRLGRAGAVGRSLLGHGQARTGARVSLLCSPPDVSPYESNPAFCKLMRESPLRLTRSPNPPRSTRPLPSRRPVARQHSPMTYFKEADVPAGVPWYPRRRPPP